jgi:hypothetical protein
LALPMAAALAIGWVAWYRLSLVTPESNPQAYWAREGQIAYARLPTVPVTERGRIADAVQGAPYEDPGGLLKGRGELVGSLRTTVAEYLQARLNATSPEGYARWMEERGYRFLSDDEFASRFRPLEYYAGLAGIRSKNIREIFAGMWSFAPSAASQPDAVCVGEGATTISIGEARVGVPFSTELRGSLGRDLWQGGSAATCTFWMRPPIQREGVIRTRGRVLAAKVGIIVCVPNSGRRPLVISAFCDPADNRWWVDGATVTNFIGDDRVWTCPEF